MDIELKRYCEYVFLIPKILIDTDSPNRSSKYSVDKSDFT